MTQKNRHLRTIGQLCPAVSSHLRHVSTIGKMLLNSNMSSTCLHNMAIFGPLAAEISSVVWATPANFNGFRDLAALLHDTLVVGGRQPNFAALNRGRHLYSAGRPSRWALAHISSLFIFFKFWKIWIWYIHHLFLKRPFSCQPGSAVPLSFLPPLLLDENLWRRVRVQFNKILLYRSVHRQNCHKFMQWTV